MMVLVGRVFSQRIERAEVWDVPITAFDQTFNRTTAADFSLGPFTATLETPPTTSGLPVALLARFPFTLTTTGFPSSPTAEHWGPISIRLRLLPDGSDTPINGSAFIDGTNFNIQTNQTHVIGTWYTELSNHPIPMFSSFTRLRLEFSIDNSNNLNSSTRMLRITAPAGSLKLVAVY